MAYAEGTSVPVERSRAEIERVLTKYGADAFSSGWEAGRQLEHELQEASARVAGPCPYCDRRDGHGHEFIDLEEANKVTAAWLRKMADGWIDEQGRDALRAAARLAAAGEHWPKDGT